MSWSLFRGGATLPPLRIRLQALMTHTIGGLILVKGKPPRKTFGFRGFAKERVSEVIFARNPRVSEVEGFRGSITRSFPFVIGHEPINENVESSLALVVMTPIGCTDLAFGVFQSLYRKVGCVRFGIGVDRHLIPHTVFLQTIVGCEDCIRVLREWRFLNSYVVHRCTPHVFPVESSVQMTSPSSFIEISYNEVALLLNVSLERTRTFVPFILLVSFVPPSMASSSLE